MTPINGGSTWSWGDFFHDLANDAWDVVRGVIQPKTTSKTTTTGSTSSQTQSVTTDPLFGLKAADSYLLYGLLAAILLFLILKR